MALHVIDGQMVRRQMGLDVVLLHFALCTCRSIAFCFMSRRRWEVEGLHDTPERPSDRASAAKRAARSPQFLSHRHSACTGEILVYSFGSLPLTESRHNCCVFDPDKPVEAFPVAFAASLFLHGNCVVNVIEGCRC